MCACVTDPVMPFRSWVYVKRAWSVWFPSSSVWWSGAKTCTSTQTSKLTWVSLSSTLRYIWHTLAWCCVQIMTLFSGLCFSGQEHPSDDGGELKLPEQLIGRRDSISSLDSTVSSGVAVSQADHPEQYEVIKQQKDIIEHGIDLWVHYQSAAKLQSGLLIPEWARVALLTVSTK